MQAEAGPLCPAGNGTLGGCILQLVLGIAVMVILFLLVGCCCLLPWLQRRQEPKVATRPVKHEFAAGGVRTRTNAKESARTLSTVLPRKRVSFATQEQVVHELAAAQDDVEHHVTHSTPKLPAEANEIEEVLLAAVTGHVENAAFLLPWLVEAFASLGVSTCEELAEQLESTTQGGNTGAASWMCTRDALLMHVQKALQDAGLTQNEVRPLWTAVSGLLSRALRRFELQHRRQQAQHQEQQQQPQPKLASCAPSTLEGEDEEEEQDEGEDLDGNADEELEQALSVVEVTQAKLALLNASVCKAPRHQVSLLLAQQRKLQQDPAYCRALLLLEERHALHIATAIDDNSHEKSPIGDGCLHGGCIVRAPLCDNFSDTIVCVDDDGEIGVRLEQHVEPPAQAYDQPARSQDQLLLRL